MVITIISPYNCVREEGRISMKGTPVYYFLFILPIIFGINLLAAKSTVKMQEHYKKIADGLIGIRKEFPPTQPKIYAILDQLDKLHTLAKKAVHKKQLLKQEKNELFIEKTALKKEVATAQNELSSIKGSVENEQLELTKKLEVEKIQVEKLMQERKILLTKIAQFEKSKDARKKESVQTQVFADQPNLNRISTSDPNSPC